MYSLLSPFFTSLMTFLWSLLATPVSIELANMFRLLDVPGGRKGHAKITPRGAGIVLWMGFLLWALMSDGYGLTAPYIATGATGVFLVGYMDDMHPLPPIARLSVHLAAALWVTSPLPVDIASRALLCLWIAGVTNAFNLIDGMDGLSLSLALNTILVAHFFSWSSSWLPFAGLVGGVLLWNFPKARTFLGDGGSTLLGFLCSSQIVWDIHYISGEGFFALAIILFLVGGVPVLDTLIAMTRRVINKKSPFLPDRGHAHHKLLDAGLSKLAVLGALNIFHSALLIAGFYLCAYA